MGTNCAPLVADLFLCNYEKDLPSLSDNKQARIIEAVNSTSRLVEDLLNTDSHYLDDMVNRIHPPELQLNNADISGTELPFSNLRLSVSKRICFFKIYDKPDY